MDNEYPDLPTIGSVVEAATRAPSVHNTQPWSWMYDGVSLHLHADWTRRLRHGDPDGRDLLISCGAALHHATVAAAAHGWATTVRRMPGPLDDQRLATISFTPGPRSEVRQAALAAIHERHTDRRTPSPVPVPQEKLDGLARAAALHGAFATVLPDESTDQLRDMMMLASVLQNSSDGYLDELAQWTRSGDEDGVPSSSVVFRPGQVRPSADDRFGGGALLDHEPDGDAPRQAWLLLTTSSDDPVSRLRAGEALSAILLMSMLQGLAVVPYTQPIEVDSTRSGLEHTLLRGSSNLQVILRVAVPPPDRPAVRRTKRRPVSEVLLVPQYA